MTDHPFKNVKRVESDRTGPALEVLATDDRWPGFFWGKRDGIGPCTYITEKFEPVPDTVTVEIRRDDAKRFTNGVWLLQHNKRIADAFSKALKEQP